MPITNTSNTTESLIFGKVERPSTKPTNTKPDPEKPSFALTLTEEEIKAGYTIDKLRNEKVPPIGESFDTLKAREKAEAEAAKRAKKTYGKDMFLKLMVTQMKHQDPLEPMDNKDMLNQIAMFTGVEQISNLYNSFEKFAKDYSGEGEISKEIKKLNANMETLITAMDIKKVEVEGEDGKKTTKITGGMDEFLALYEKTYTALFHRLNSLEQEIKKLAKL